MRPIDKNEQHPLRVTAIRPIITEEGDLIPAGTPGTVIRWDYDSHGQRTEHVWVQWDHYLFFGEPGSDVNLPHADTHRGLHAATPFDNLRWSPT